MTANSTSSTRPSNLMYRLLFQAETDFNNNRRSEQRFPFFRPVSIRVDGLSLTAFTREISASGIGLMHNMDLPKKEVEILIAGERQVLPARVERCDPSGEGWFISGCTIIGSNA
jgi:hypothetical protein